MIEVKIKGYISEALLELGIADVPFALEHPQELTHGDFATNVAMIGAKKAGKNPRALAEEIVSVLKKKNDENIFNITIAGPGFINFTLSQKYFTKALEGALQEGENFGHNKTLEEKKVLVEYTDPNPFKEFHIGHLMSNAIGESISRLVEASGAETKRACYQGDVGLHVATAIWAISKSDSADWEELLLRGKAYAQGAKAYKEDEQAKKEIQEINKKLYHRSDEALNTQYDQGRSNSLALFEKMYKRLGTKFDHYFFESKSGEFGKEIVLSRPEIFVASEGAIIYKGDEAKGLHTRVFVNKEGLPTYEAKELGLAKIKYDAYPYDTSIVITGNEVNDYFKVLLDAMSKVFPELAAKTEHYSHGMLRLPTGKMSSRTGDVIVAAELIDDTKERVKQKIADSVFADEEKAVLTEQVAIGAIKYSILRQASGKDIIFDFEQSLSFEGDSGPYLQYTYARTCSLLTKAGEKKIDVATIAGESEVNPLHKYLLRFPHVVLRAQEERAPHYIATYLIELAREFNSFYGNTMILDGAPDEGYKLALVTLTRNVLKQGLWLLGISAPSKM